MHRFLIYFLLISSFVKSQAEDFLDKNHVKAKIGGANHKFCCGDEGAYQVPKNGKVNAFMSNSIWIGGLDKGGQLHMAVSMYGNGEFTPGPMDTVKGESIKQDYDGIYNRVWKIDCDQISDFIAATKAGAVKDGTYKVPDGILNYPAIGEETAQRNLSPFKDVNNNGRYDPVNDGDYPLIMGDQQVLSIYNDGKLHSMSKAANMGIEVHQHSFVFFDPGAQDTMQAINYTTFHYYEIYNRTIYDLFDVYLADWSDADLGDPTDDFIGTDSVNGFAYFYNANDFDKTLNEKPGYGSRPPVVSHLILPVDCSHDGIDNDHDGTVDNPGEAFKMDRVSYYFKDLSGPPAMTDPRDAGFYFYNYLSGFWKDGSPFTYGGNGYGGTAACPYAFTGNPATNSGWTEKNGGNTPGDKVMLMTSGPFDFPAKSKIEWGYALVFSQDTLQGGNAVRHLNSRIKRDVQNVIHYYKTHRQSRCDTNRIYFAPVNTEELNMVSYLDYDEETLHIRLNYKITQGNLTLFEVTGKKLFETEASGSHLTLNVSDLAEGIYLIKLEAEEKVIVQKWRRK